MAFHCDAAHQLALKELVGTVINAYWHFIVMQSKPTWNLIIGMIVINAYWHFIVMQCLELVPPSQEKGDQRLLAFHCDAGQWLESLIINASFSILQAPLMIEQSISKNSSSY